MERKRVKDSVTILLIFFLVAGFPLISTAEEATIKVKPEKEKAAIAPKAEKKAALNIKAGSGDTLGVELVNSVPVRGTQFTISGVKITEVRTTKRTAGFLAKFNEKNGIVILISTSDDKIAPGNGSIAEVICDKPGSAQLSGVKIAGSNREPL